MRAHLSPPAITLIVGASNHERHFQYRHRRCDARRPLRPPLAPARLLALFSVIFLAIITGIMIVFAVLAFTMQWALSLA